MAASRGSDNWNKNWRGKGDIPTLVKSNDGVLYEEDGTKSNTSLTKGSPVTYIDSQSGSHTRAAIRFGDKVFLTNIDNLVKPKSLGQVNLKPQAFNLGGDANTLPTYLLTLKNAIKNRPDIKGNLEEYLLDLVKYVEFGSSSISGYDLTELPIASITSDFGEVIGPIYAIKSGLANLNLGVNLSSQIIFPSSGTEPLLDYFIKTSTNTYKVSQKSKGTANTLKMNAIVPQVIANNNLLLKYGKTNEFLLMKIINDFPINVGAVQGCALVGLISQDQLASVSSLRRNSVYISDLARRLFRDMIRKDARLKNYKNISFRNIAYLCEKKLVEYTKQTMVSQRMTNIVKDVLNNEVYYIKMGLDNGVPNFTTSSTSDRSISNLYFRNKNGYESTSDKLGFKV
tara:strand:+ start:130 stop:1323 length:1194 start_codon:yes stop_codon:yes gene_type:complete